MRKMQKIPLSRLFSPPDILVKRIADDAFPTIVRGLPTTNYVIRLDFFSGNHWRFRSVFELEHWHLATGK